MAKQIVIEVGQDRKLKRTTKPGIGEWLYDENNQEAWFTLRKLYSVFGFLKGKMGLVIDKRFALPLNPYGGYKPDEITLLTNLDARADQALNIAIGQAEKQGRHNIVAWGITIAISGFVLVVIILALLIASERI